MTSPAPKPYVPRHAFSLPPGEPHPAAAAAFFRRLRLRRKPGAPVPATGAPARPQTALIGRDTWTRGEDPYPQAAFRPQPGARVSHAPTAAMPAVSAQQLHQDVLRRVLAGLREMPGSAA